MRTMTVAVVAAVLAVPLAGCATSAATTSPPSSWALDTPTPPATISGEGSAPFPGMEFPIPDGSQSVTLAFACEGGGRFEVELGDSMALGQSPLRGTCDGTHTLAWPVTAQTEPTLTVQVGDGVTWTATSAFSTSLFAADALLTTDCDAFSPIFSALYNADQGYTLYSKIDETEWAARVDAATADLATLAASSTSSVAPSLAQLSELVSKPDRTAGAALTPYFSATDPVFQACEVNQTPVAIMAEFGG